MTPLTLFAAQKLVSLLTDSAAIETEVSSLSASSGMNVPLIPATQVYVSSAPAAMADLQQQLGYPRITAYTSKVRNTQVEKFRGLSGTAIVTTDITATADLVSDVDTWLHFYAEAVTNILRNNRGDWGGGIFYSGSYDVTVQAPVTGASGFLQLARINIEVGISRS